jgi:molybdopterin synthase sulfur carrier subunit
MATVWIPALLRGLTQGRESIEVPGNSVRQIIDNLEVLCPGVKARLVSGDELRPGIAVAVDSQLAQSGLAQPLPDNCEVHFVPAISGGST